MNSLNQNKEAKSEVTAAVKKADADQIDKNLHKDESVGHPQDLTNEEETPFIDKKENNDK